MSRDIDYIVNVQAFATLGGTDEFTLQGGFPTNPDEVVIRQITYGHSVPNGEMILIHSNLSNGIIGAIGGINGFTSNPGTRIQTRNPITSVLTFKLMTTFNPPVPLELQWIWIRSASAWTSSNTNNFGGTFLSGEI